MAIQRTIPKSPFEETESDLASRLSRLEEALATSGYQLKPPDEPLPTRAFKGAVGGALDLISRPNYASAAAYEDVARGGDIFSASGAFLKELVGTGEQRQKQTFGDVFEELGYAEGAKFQVPGAEIANKIPIVGDILPDEVSTRGALGFAADVVLDPLNWLSFGTAAGAKKIGMAGAKKALTEVGEAELRKLSQTTFSRLAKRAAGRASPEILAEAASKMAERELLEKWGTKAGQNLFQVGGVGWKAPFTNIGGNLIPGTTIEDATKALISGTRRIPVAGHVFGAAVDLGAKAKDIVKEATGRMFIKDYDFVKNTGKVLDVDRRAMETMGITNEAVLSNMKSDIGQIMRDQLRFVQKDRTYAAQQGMKLMVDTFAKINVDDAATLTKAMEGVKGAYEALSPQAQMAYKAAREIVDLTGEEGLELGLWKRLVEKNFTPRATTDEASQWLKDNLQTSNKAYAGLIKQFSPKVSKSRILLDEETFAKIHGGLKTDAAKKKFAEKFETSFLGVPIKENTIEEINKIAREQLGFDWFEGDFTKAMTRYYVNFAANKTLIEGLQTLPEAANREAGINMFKPVGQVFNPRQQIPPEFQELMVSAQRANTKTDFLNQFTRGEKIILNKDLRDKGYNGLKDFFDASTAHLKPIKEFVYPGYKRFSIDPLSSWQAPKFVVDQVEQTFKILTNDESVHKFIRSYDRALSLWKGSVTVLFPSFHTQNFIGGQFFNYLAGITPGTPKWVKRMNQTTNLIGKVDFGAGKLAQNAEFLSQEVGEGAIKNMTWQGVLDLYNELGVSGGFYRGDVGESVFRKVFGAGNDPMNPSGVQQVLDKASSVGSVVEDFNRLPLFIEELTKHGDPRRAAKQVWKFQFDYGPEAYTEIERQFFSRLVPFYKFMRGNVPLVLDQAYHNSSKMLMIKKAVENFGEGADPDKPAWMQNSFTIKLPPEVAQLLGKKSGEKVFVSFNLPVFEFMKLEPKALMSSVTPFLRIPTELATNQEWFYGNQIWDTNLPAEQQTSRAYPFLKVFTQLPIVGDALADAMKWKEFPIIDPKTGIDSGKRYYEADPLMVYALKNFFGGLGRAYALIGRGTEEGRQTETMVESLFPINIEGVSPEEARYKRMKQMDYTLGRLESQLKKQGVKTTKKVEGRFAKSKKTARPDSLDALGPWAQQYIQAYQQ